MKWKAYGIIGTVCLVLCILCLAVAFLPQDDTDPIQMMVELPKSETPPGFEIQTPLPDETMGGSETTADLGTERESEPELEPYVSPIDFEKIQSENSDIYAWIHIPDTEISYPLLQRKKDDVYYLSHDSSGAAAEAGAIFTESSYNSKTFDDPVTVVYGHRMNSGARFGELQEIFSDPESFQKHEKIVVYTPEQEFHYQIFAAVPYKKNHILSNYNFYDRSEFDSFLNVIFKTEGGANFRKDVSVTSEDRLLVLSTCLKWDASRRYLVLAKLMKSEQQLRMQ